MPQPVAKNYVSENDEVVLEDEVQRIQLIGSIEIAKLVTGRKVHDCWDILGFLDLCHTKPPEPLQESYVGVTTT